MNKYKIILALSLVFSLNLLSFSAQSTAKKPADKPEKIELKNFKALDYPYDKGGLGLLTWDITEDEKDASFTVMVSTISEKEGFLASVEFNSQEKLASKIDLPFWSFKKSDQKHAVKIDFNAVLGDKVMTDLPYFAKVVMVKNNKTYETEVYSSKIVSNWFRYDRINNLIILLIVSAVFFMAVSHAKKKGLFIRRIAGLDAIDEAIGRATEMGKPIFYVPGIGSMSSISTIASTFILGEVSKKVAQYDSYIKVPHYDPIVMTVAKEIVKQSYTEAERPDSYRDDINIFVSADQFSYAASVDGMMTREKPAACFFMGYFMAESLLLAEVGSSIGAIQIAGTDSEHQLPFFFTACDYTLIGEELYAAGAYLSREPMLLSALKVQDFGKLLFMVTVGLFSIGLMIAAKFELKPLADFFTNILKVY